MAQAPIGGAPPGGQGGLTEAPRQNKSIKDFSGMNTQNERNALKEGSFHWLENIQPIGPGNLHSIPGRGPGLTHIPPPPPPTTCPDSTPIAPGSPPVLPVVCCYNSLNWDGVLGSTNHGMFAHADDNGDFWHTPTLASGFSSGPYPVASPTPTWFLLGPILGGSPPCQLEERTPLTLPGGATADFQSTQTPQGGVCGMSDEKSYRLTLANITPHFFIGGSSFDTATVAYFGENSGVSYLRSSTNEGFGGNAWCKAGGFYYAAIPTSNQFAAWPIAGAPTFETLRVNLTDMLPGWVNSFDPAGAIVYIHASSTYLYLIVTGAFGGGPVEYRIYKVLRSDLSYVTHWVLTGNPDFPSPWGLHVFSDNLIFLVQGRWTVGNFITDDGSTSIVGTAGGGTGCTNSGNPGSPPGQSGFYYAKNYYYFSYSGYAFGNTNVLKLGPVVCPSNPALPWQS